jgi:hypothetical protein
LIQFIAERGGGSFTSGYSTRSARMGSMEAARQAGIKPASRAHAVSTYQLSAINYQR